MTNLDQQIEQKIDLYESRLKHFDELLARSSKGVTGHPEQADIQAQIANLRAERDRFARHIDALKQGSSEDLEEEMIEKSGPMAIWDVLAQQLEKLVERIER